MCVLCSGTGWLYRWVPYLLGHYNDETGGYHVWRQCGQCRTCGTDRDTSKLNKQKFADAVEQYRKSRNFCEWWNMDEDGRSMPCFNKPEFLTCNPKGAKVCSQHKCRCSQERLQAEAAHVEKTECTPLSVQFGGVVSPLTVGETISPLTVGETISCGDTTSETKSNWYVQEDRSKPVIYVASKTKHALMWRAIRDVLKDRAVVNSSWIDEAGEGQTENMADLMMRCVYEAREASVLVLYFEKGDTPLKTALVEVGAALGANVPVFVVGAEHLAGHSWLEHPLASIYPSLSTALTAACRIPDDDDRIKLQETIVQTINTFAAEEEILSKVEDLCKQFKLQFNLQLTREQLRQILRGGK